jgi:hypothetical protein
MEGISFPVWVLKKGPIKMRIVWLLSLVIMLLSGIYAGAYYLAFLGDIFIYGKEPAHINILRWAIIAVNFFLPSFVGYLWIWDKLDDLYHGRN